jgi:hypothetical protein
MDNVIKVGDTVRSFDFPDTTKDIEGDNACFVEGVVEGIGRFIEWQACDMYKIKCTRKVFGGEERDNHEEYYFAPINGTSKFGGGVTDGVVKVL